MNYIEQIQTSKHLKESEREQALNDRFEMTKSKKYAQSVGFDSNQSQLRFAFLWEKSNLGYEFWNEINKLINTK